MAFRLPNFNLRVSIWRVNGTGGAYAAPDVSTMGNLSPAARGYVLMTGHTANTAFATLGMTLRLPALTDIRPSWNGLIADVVEVPAGSLRFYTVWWVDDVAKGFTNEYRVAELIMQTQGNIPIGGGPNNVPTPLP